MLNYQAIEIFTSEEARYRGIPVADAVVDYIRKLKIAARCIVTRGIAGCYESGEVCTTRLEVLSFNLPIRIYITLPASAAERVLAGLEEMVGDGLIARHDLRVVSHKAANTFFPRQLLVKDVMTAQPKSIGPADPLSDAARLLLSSIFTGLPVVDHNGRPIGVITQGDLINRAALPLRLGLLTQSGQDGVESVMQKLALRNVKDAMTTPAVIVAEDQPLSQAVNLMLAHDLKRLPVVDDAGRLSGMLSRLDIFRTVMREAPDWDTFRAQKIEVKNLRTVGDILRRDTHTVFPETTIDEVIRMIDENDIQRVAVIDAEGLLLGIISDRDLLHYFKPDHEGLRYLFSKAARAFGKDGASAGNMERQLATTRAGEVMIREVATIREKAVIEEAIRLMADQGLKRLPVVDDDGRFKGMISRDSLLRSGFARTDSAGDNTA